MSAESISSNKRIAKNTFFLYIRMFVLLAVGLYTARVVLEALGETDYGIYNIIGGVVVLFSFLNQSLTIATQRFLNYSLGKGDKSEVNRIFCMSMNAYIMLSVLCFVLAETVGLWFVTCELNIPEDRHIAAFWVYQFSVITFILNLLRIPYNATIIAYEKMNFFAYVSLLEAFLKLGIVYLLFVIPIDRLELYAGLYIFPPLIFNIVYRVYCYRNFDTTRYRRLWDRKIFCELFSFSGWSLFGSGANMAVQQGINILINLFFGVTVNAAAGIANNVSSHVKQFVSNFQTAFQPQLVKTYAGGKFEEFYSLIYRTSKFSYYLMFVMALPLILVTNSLLDIWLTEVPKYTAIFCQLILVNMLIEAISTPMWMSVHAKGKIRNYEVLMSGCFLVNLPLCYLAYKLGYPVYSVWIVRIILNIATYIVRVWYLRYYVGLRLREFIRQALLPLVIVTIVSVPIPFISSLYMQHGWQSLIIVPLVSLITTLISIYFFGLSVSERQLVRGLILKRISKHKPQSLANTHQ